MTNIDFWYAEVLLKTINVSKGVGIGNVAVSPARTPSWNMVTSFTTLRLKP
jgi:hypothetical protein